MRKKTLNETEKFGKLLSQAFPPIKLALGYGSAFFRQKNYDYEKKKFIYDLIFVVEDRLEWHKENMKMNRGHYGGLSYLFGANFLNVIQNSLCPIHYNPFVFLDEYEVKYGVISQKDFKRDLLGWQTLIVSGRMQKPIKKLLEEENFDDMIKQNLQTAVSAALILDGRSSLSDKELFLNIVSLSYFGDIRFTLKGENKDKIINIVEGQYEQLQELYYPILNTTPFKDILKIQDSILFPKFTLENRHKLISMLPSGFGTDYVGKNKDFQQSLMLRSDEQREVLKDALIALNTRNSRNMLLYHILTVSPMKNIQYGFRKLAKGFSNK